MSALVVPVLIREQVGSLTSAGIASDWRWLCCADTWAR